MKERKTGFCGAVKHASFEERRSDVPERDRDLKVFVCHPYPFRPSFDASNFRLLLEREATGPYVFGTHSKIQTRTVLC